MQVLVSIHFPLLHVVELTFLDWADGAIRHSKNGRYNYFVLYHYNAEAFKP